MTTILFGTEDRERAPVDETIVFSSILIEQTLIQIKKKVKKKELQGQEEKQRHFQLQ